MQPAAALYSTGANFDWSDFSNNFASDLTPLLSLFGENPTKQFLSESTSFLDSILFGLAPIGVITTLTSVIRLYGSVRMRSIIGKSQEPRGVAETELCSSTSEDVCELWSNGGICRVFGRPKVLAFIFSKDEAQFYSQGPTDQALCGIETLSEALSGLGVEDPSLEGTAYQSKWKEVGKPHLDRNFAPNPNMSLNIGVKERPRLRLLFVILGFILQAGFVAFMWWATYRVPKFYDSTKGQSPTTWAFLLSVVGTMLLNFGMILCAWLVDKKSCERVFQRKDGASRVFWLQPGGQRVGDQLFSAFAYSDKADAKHVQYITSWRMNDFDANLDPDEHRGWTYWLAIATSLLGWVMQFVGLRGVPGVISLVLLFITLVMSILRALVRSSRLERQDNALHGDSKVEGHELDWQALTLAQSYLPGSLGPESWFIGAESSTHETSTDETLREQTAMDQTWWHFNSGSTTALDWIVKKEFMTLKQDSNKEHSANKDSTSQRSSSASIIGNPNEAARAMRFRARLAVLTGTPATKSEQAWAPDVFSLASKLQNALETSADYISLRFSLQGGWTNTDEFAWSATCDTGQGRRLPVCFFMSKRNGRWSTDRSYLEAALGLWLWSLGKHSGLKECHANETYGTKNLVVKKARMNDMVAAIKLWAIADHDRLQLEYETRGLRPSLLSVPTAQAIKARSSNASNTFTSERSRESLQETVRLYLTTKDSLLQLMAQDLFTIFISRIVSIMTPLGNASQREPKSTDIFGPQESQFLGLTNAHVEMVAEYLISAGVASREEAFMSLVPALEPKLPSIDNMAESLLAKAKTLRRAGDFQASENLLDCLFYGGPPTMQNRVLRQIGEVYRANIRSSKSRQSDTGTSPRAASTANGWFSNKTESKLKTMRNQISSIPRAQGHQAGPTDEDVKAAEETKKCYEIVLARLQTRAGGDKQPWDRASLPANWRSVAVLDALQRAEALMYTEDYELTECTTDDLLDILFFAITNNVPELVEDMWWVNRNLVNEHRSVHPDERLSGWRSSRVHETPLSWAIKSDFQQDIMASILDWPGVSIELTSESTGSDSRTPLILAIEEGNEDASCVLLQKGANWNMVMEIEGFPLSFAARRGLRETVQQILDLGASQLRSMVVQALQAAVKAGQPETTEALLQCTEHSSYRNETHDWNQKLLLLAVESRQKFMVKFLLGRGAKINGQVTWTKSNNELQTIEGDTHWSTALSVAIGIPDLELIKYLIGLGADVNTESEKGDALMQAIAESWGQGTEVVHFLVKDCHAAITRPTSRGDYGNPLVAACFVDAFHDSFSRAGRLPNRLAAANLILAQCEAADINALVEHGEFGTALVAAAASKYVKLAQMLIKQSESLRMDIKALVNTQVAYGEYGSALNAAVACGRLETCKYLCRVGADVNMQVEHGRFGSALAAALVLGRGQRYGMDMVQSLLRCGADVDLRLDHGDYGNALLAAIMHGSVNAVRLLVEGEDEDSDEDEGNEAGHSCADVNAPLHRGKYGYGNVLMAAAHVRRVECVETLLDAGARVSGMSAWGRFRTVLEAAQAPLDDGDDDRGWLNQDDIDKATRQIVDRLEERLAEEVNRERVQVQVQVAFQISPF